MFSSWDLLKYEYQHTNSKWITKCLDNLCDIISTEQNDVKLQFTAVKVFCGVYSLVNPKISEFQLNQILNFCGFDAYQSKTITRPAFKRSQLSSYHVSLSCCILLLFAKNISQTLENGLLKLKFCFQYLLELPNNELPLTLALYTYINRPKEISASIQKFLGFTPLICNLILI